MRRLFFVLAACCACNLGCNQLFPVDWEAMKKPSTPTPASPSDPGKPSETFGLELSIPKVMTDRTGALALAELADEYAEQIQYDGQRKEPQVTTTADVGRKFKLLNEYAWKGTNKVVTAEFKKLTGELVKKELEPDGKPEQLDEDSRKTAVELFRAIAYGLRQVPAATK